jgi:hypothetical protein
MSDIALLVLENPWDEPVGGTRRMTVLPFFEGLERIHTNLAVYYSSFYNLAGIRAALDLDLQLTKEPRQILYIGSHGRGKMLANIRLADLRRSIRERADRIEGVIVSSCEVCSDSQELVKLVEGTTIRWAIGYRSSVSWFDSMVIELALLNSLAEQPAAYKSTRESLQAFFGAALQLLNPQHILDPTKGTLSENITIVLNSRPNARPRIFQLS